MLKGPHVQAYCYNSWRSGKQTNQFNLILILIELLIVSAAASDPASYLLIIIFKTRTYFFFISINQMFLIFEIERKMRSEKKIINL